METTGRANENGSVGQIAHVGHRAGGVGGVAALLLLAGGLMGCSSDGAKATTTVTQAADAVVVTAAGRSVPAHDGQKLARGDVIRTGHGGSATLNTAGRIAYLGADGAYALQSGISAVLQRGAF